jgi:hypothetical protein
MRLAVLPLFATLFLASCASSREPVGFPLERDLSEYSGVWENPEAKWHVSCDKEGNLEFAEWCDDTKKFEPAEMRGKILRLNDEFHMLNVKCTEDEDADDEYMFMLTSLKNGDRFVCWSVNNEAIGELMEAGKLKGKEAVDSGPALSDDGEKIAKALEEYGLEKSFTWQDPVVYTRKTKELPQPNAGESSVSKTNELNTEPEGIKIVNLGYAGAIPGDRLHVLLPGEFKELGPISIEQVDASGNRLGIPWPDGTEMEGANPNVPGGKIYFKIPGFKITVSQG